MAEKQKKIFVYADWYGAVEYMRPAFAFFY